MTDKSDELNVKLDGAGQDEYGSWYRRFRILTEPEQTVLVSQSQINNSATELWSRLGQHGAVLATHSAKRELLGKIQSAGLNATFLVATRLGWRDGAFVTPRRVYGKASLPIELHFPDAEGQSKHRRCGKLKEWQEHIGDLCAGNSRLIFGVCAAFAGPLLALLGVPSLGFQLVGSSSIGKSIWLRVEGSVWGCHPDFVHRGFSEDWATTANAIEKHATAHQGGFLPLDETHLAGAGDQRKRAQIVKSGIFTLFGGTEKHRLTAPDRRAAWSLVFASTSNESTQQILAAGGFDYDDAYRVRFPDIDAHASAEHGVFENIHGFGTSKEFADALADATTQYFGAPIDEFLKDLVHDRATDQGDLINWLRERMALYCRKSSPAPDKADGRVRDTFALIYAAGRLAQAYDVVPWTKVEIREAVQACEAAHYELLARTHGAADPVADVRRYIEAHKAAFPDVTIQKLDLTNQEFRASHGFTYRRKGHLEYLIPADQFERTFGLRAKHVLSALARAGYLKCDAERHVVKRPIRQNPVRDYVHCVSGDILNTR